MVPDGIDVLLTHGPPANHGGLLRWDNSDVGCEDLHAAATKRIRPKVHVFGHVHEGYGVTNEASTVFVNCSTCNHAYKRT
jgi:Icc-related predicted phosphoesterase